MGPVAVTDHDDGVLGAPRVDRADVRALPLRPKAWALLARVALAEEPVPRAELARWLFAEVDQPRAGLRWYLSNLRAALPENLRDGLVLGRDRVGFRGLTDVAVFRGHAAGLARASEDAAATGHGGLDEQAQILELYRGDLCEGLVVSASVSFDTWLFVEQEALRRVFRQMVLAFARRALAAGQPRLALPSLARLVSVEPYCEDGHLLLIAATEQAGTDHDPAQDDPAQDDPAQGDPFQGVPVRSVANGAANELVAAGVAAPAPAARAAYDQYQRIVRTELHGQPRASVAARYEDRPVTGPELPAEDLIPLATITQHIVEWPGPEPTVLGIHGSAQSAYSLTALGERLTGVLRFIGVDLRGHGFSDKPPRGYTVADHVADLRQLIGALGLRRPIVLGHSLGGAVATFLAAAEPVGGLILLDGVVGDRAFVANAAAGVVGSFAAELDQRFGGFSEYLEHWHRGSPRGTYGATEEGWIRRCARYTVAPLPDGTVRMRALRRALEDEWASVGHCDGLAALRRVSCPVLIVHATQPWPQARPYLPDTAIAAQLTAARTARLHVAHGCDHETVVRDPDPELIETITAFART